MQELVTEDTGVRKEERSAQCSTVGDKEWEGSTRQPQ